MTERNRVCMILTLGLVMVLPIVAHFAIKAYEPDEVKCKYAICMLYPKTEVIEGWISTSDEKFDSMFLKDYNFSGQGPYFPKDSLMDGVLVVSNERSLVSIPIGHWTTSLGKSIFLCQGIDSPGKAPRFYVMTNSRETLIQEIKDKLRSGKDK